jgi:branched-chain amino acid transport system permease protein
MIIRPIIKIILGKNVEQLQFIVNGLAVGSIYGLVALGFVLIYKATEQVSFAQGDILMFGAFVAVSLYGIYPNYWVAAAGSIILMGVFGYMLDVVVIRRIIGQNSVAAVLLTIGLAFVLRACATMIWGTDSLPLPSPIDTYTLKIGNLTIAGVHLAIIAFTFMLSLTLYFFFAKTRIGLAMQAVSQNQIASYYVGIPVKTITSLIWGLSGMISCAAGVLLAPITLVDANLGYVAISSFAAAVIGGFGSIPGALIGGIVVGIVESFAALKLGAGFKEIASPALILLTLILRPEGFFGGHGKRKV